MAKKEGDISAFYEQEKRIKNMIHDLEVVIVKDIDGLAGNRQNTGGDWYDEPVLDDFQQAAFVANIISRHFNVVCTELDFWIKNGLEKPEQDTINRIKHFFEGHKAHAERFEQTLRKAGEDAWKVSGDLGNAKKNMQKAISELER